MTYADTILAMLAGHALADFPLQGEWLAKAKNHRIVGLVPGETVWPGALAAHSAIHGGVVALATGSWKLGVAEFVAHCVIDYMKCDGRLGYNQDQLMHVAFKFLWLSLLAFGLS